MNNYSIGGEGESRATELLTQKGLQIIERNFQYYTKGRGRKGEIDIIAYDNVNATLHFVEVKTRTNSVFGFAIEQITHSKIQSLRSAIEYYCLIHQEYSNTFKQIDVIVIDGKQDPVFFGNVVTFDY